MKNASGMFITFEGISGSGKSTLSTAVAKYISSLFYTVVQTELLEATPITKAIGNILLNPVEPRTEMFLQQACRAEFIKTVLAPDLCKGSVIVCENYTPPILVQFGAEEKEATDVLCACSAYGVVPDITFILDVSPSVSKQRSLGTTQRTAECVRLRKAYRKMANDPNCYLIDADRPLSEVFDEVLDILGIGENPEYKPTTDVVSEPPSLQDKEEGVETIEEVEHPFDNPILDECLAKQFEKTKKEEGVTKEGVPYICTTTSGLSDGVRDKTLFLRALDEAVVSGLPMISLLGVDIATLHSKFKNLPKIGKVVSYTIDNDRLYFNIVTKRDTTFMLGIGETGSVDNPKMVFVYPTDSNGELV